MKKTKQKTKQLDKSNYKFWLGHKAVHYLINWRAGFDCFGYEIPNK